MTLTMKSSFCLVVLCATLAGVSASAHHSISAEFDESKRVTVMGTVSKMEWVNPHAHFFVEGEDTSHQKGTWDFELTPPAMLMRKGWTRNSLKPGDVVTVIAVPHKDTPFAAHAREVTRSDGSKVFEGATEPDVR
jgi:hypothetical protein